MDFSQSIGSIDFLAIIFLTDCAINYIRFSASGYFCACVGGAALSHFSCVSPLTFLTLTNYLPFFRILIIKVSDFRELFFIH